MYASSLHPVALIILVMSCKTKLVQNNTTCSTQPKVLIIEQVGHLWLGWTVNTRM